MSVFPVQFPFSLKHGKKGILFVIAVTVLRMPEIKFIRYVLGALKLQLSMRRFHYLPKYL